MALSDRRDDHHDAAAALLRTHAHAELLTTNHVRGETWTFLNRRLGHRAATTFLDRSSRTPRVTTLFVDEVLEHEALRWLRRRGEREYSYVDATSFVVMRSKKIREALAFDGDFAAAGFVELRP